MLRNHSTLIKYDFAAPEVHMRVWVFIYCLHTSECPVCVHIA